MTRFVFELNNVQYIYLERHNKSSLGPVAYERLEKFRHLIQLQSQRTFSGLDLVLCLKLKDYEDLISNGGKYRSHHLLPM